MTKKELFEIAGICMIVCALVLAGIVLILLYIGALGAALGAFGGAAVWAFCRITGLCL